MTFAFRGINTCTTIAGSNSRRAVSPIIAILILIVVSLVGGLTVASLVGQLATETSSLATKINYTTKIETNSDVDPFGIIKLFPTAPGPDNEYYTKTYAESTTEFLDNGRVDGMSGFSRNEDGSWNINGSPRWYITGGWRNVEMTMQVRINSGSQVILYANGEEHSDIYEFGWHGSANKMRVFSDGSVGFVKELYHEPFNSGYSDTVAVQSSSNGAIIGRWVTVKFVSHNIADNTQHKFEGYISYDNDNKFVKVSEYVDDGNLYASTGFNAFMDFMRANYPDYVPHNRATGQEMMRNDVITWEGEYVTFRCDDANYDFKNVSVREIDAALVDYS